MSARVSVLLPSPASLARATVASLDAQTLGASGFEVLVMDDGTDAGGSARLSNLIAHRTNIRRCATSAGSPEAALAALTADADGDYVLLLRDDRQLLPTALEALCALADDTGADVCLGLTGKAGVLPRVLGRPGLSNQTDLPADDPMRASDAGRIVRRSVVDSARTESTPEALDAALTRTATRVAAVTTRACFVDTGAALDGHPLDQVAAGHSAKATAVRWSVGVLDLRIEISPAAGVAHPDSWAVSAYSSETGVAWRLPDQDVLVAPSEQEGITVLKARVDAGRLVAEGLLTDGTWWLALHPRSADKAVPIRVSPGRAAGGCQLDRPIVSFAQQHRLGLDVGGLTHQLVGQLRPRRARVHESARGSLLTCTVPGVRIGAEGKLKGILRVGHLPVVAWLEPGPDDDAVITAWVSGLAGSRRLATKFTPAPFADSGARLVIDGLGSMEVRATRRKPDAKGVKAQAASPTVAARETTAARPLRRAAGKLRRTAGRVRAIRQR